MVKPFSRPLLIHETSFRRKLLLNQQEPLKLLRETAVLLKLEFRRCRRDAFISFDFIAGDKVSKKMIYLHATSHLEMRSATGCVCLWNCLRIGWWDLDGVVFCWTRFILHLPISSLFCLFEWQLCILSVSPKWDKNLHFEESIFESLKTNEGCSDVAMSP